MAFPHSPHADSVAIRFIPDGFARPGWVRLSGAIQHSIFPFSTLKPAETLGFMLSAET
jgi:hypothetical protein